MDLKKHGWRIREYREGDERQILRLRRIVFGELDPVRLDLSAWQWQFSQNPAGKAFCMLAEDDGVVVGQYTAIPTRFSVFGREAVFAFSCDTMTHPAYRRQGMFVALAEALYDLMASRHGIFTVWGFPNEISLPGFIDRLQWKLLGEFPLRMMPIRPLAMIRSHIRQFRGRVSGGGAKKQVRPARAFTIPEAPGLLIEPLSRFGPDFDELWTAHRDLAPVMQVRDSAYLNWRYADLPAFGYQCFAVKSRGRLSGYLVIRLAEMAGHYCGVLVDIFPFPIVDEAVTRQLVRFARDYCKDRRAEFLTCLLPLADRKFLKKSGLIKIPDRLNPKRWYLGCRSAGKGRVPISPSDRWYVSYGDTDIV